MTHGNIDGAMPSHDLPHVCPNCGAAMTAHGRLEAERDGWKGRWLTLHDAVWALLDADYPPSCSAFARLADAVLGIDSIVNALAQIAAEKAEKEKTDHAWGLYGAGQGHMAAEQIALLHDAILARQAAEQRAGTAEAEVERLRANEEALRASLGDGWLAELERGLLILAAGAAEAAEAGHCGTCEGPDCEGCDKAAEAAEEKP